MAKRIKFIGIEEEDIKKMCNCKELVEDLRVIGFMKEHPNSKKAEPKDI